MDLKEDSNEIQQLKEKIAKLRSQTSINILSDAAAKRNAGKVDDLHLRQCRLCRGHFGKIYALDWTHDSHYIITASQDVTLIIWSGITGNKHSKMDSPSSWVMTCGFDPRYRHSAVAGLDNTVYIIQISDDEAQRPFTQKELLCELEEHEAYVSSAHHINDTELISASGDKTSILWDVTTQTPKQKYTGHDGDVFSMDVNHIDENLFVTGSIDCTARIWDIRTSNCVGIFQGHTRDINTVSWFSDGNCFLSGSDDGTVRLFDIRSQKQVQHYFGENNSSGKNRRQSAVTAIGPSHTGAYIFAAYDAGNLYVWNSLTANWVSEYQHDDQVSSLSVSPDGYCLATGCWDFNLTLFTAQNQPVSEN